MSVSSRVFIELFCPICGQDASRVQPQMRNMPAVLTPPRSLRRDLESWYLEPCGHTIPATRYKLFLRTGRPPFWACFIDMDDTNLVT